MNRIQIDGETLTLDQLYSIALDGAEVELSQQARERMNASRAVVERLIESNAAVYGVNTGFGKMASVRISREQIRTLQTNLVRSHACGVGAPLSEPEVRAMLALRANAIAKGFSGVRPVVAETLCAMLNKRVHPVIPSQGSVGASGDLAPLAHLAQVAIGEGEVILQGRRISGAEAMRAAGIAPLVLEAKEGLALLNGTQAMLALLALGLRDAEIAADTADVAAALSLDALRGSPAAFDERIARVRPYTGHAISAKNLRRLNQGSAIRESHRPPEKDPRVQDPYSLRCAPQVHGAARDALAQVRATISVELNSATDNPLVFVAANGKSGEGEIISGGNFHGQPLGNGRRSARRRSGNSRRNFRAPHRADDQSAVQPAPRVSDSRRRPKLRLHDFAGSRRSARQRNENASRSPFRGFHPHVRKSRRLRFDGNVRRAPHSTHAGQSAQCSSD